MYVTRSFLEFLTVQFVPANIPYNFLQVLPWRVCVCVRVCHLPLLHTSCRLSSNYATVGNKSLSKKLCSLYSASTDAKIEETLIEQKTALPSRATTRCKRWLHLCHRPPSARSPRRRGRTRARFAGGSTSSRPPPHPCWPARYGRYPKLGAWRSKPTSREYDHVCYE